MFNSNANCDHKECSPLSWLKRSVCDCLGILLMSVLLITHVAGKYYVKCWGDTNKQFQSSRSLQSYNNAQACKKGKQSRRTNVTKHLLVLQCRWCSEEELRNETVWKAPRMKRDLIWALKGRLDKIWRQGSPLTEDEIDNLNRKK